MHPVHKLHGDATVGEIPEVLQLWGLGKDGIIRVDDFKQACVLQSDGKVGSKGMEDFKGARPHQFFLADSAPSL